MCYTLDVYGTISIYCTTIYANKCRDAAIIVGKQEHASVQAAFDI